MKINTLFTCFFKINSKQKTTINPYHNNNESTIQKKSKKQVKLDFWMVCEPRICNILIRSRAIHLIDSNLYKDDYFYTNFTFFLILHPFHLKIVSCIIVNQRMQRLKMEKDDVQLIHRILSGEATAFNTLFQKYQKSIHAIAWQKIGDYHVAEEITQDVFLQAYNKLSTLKDPNKFSRWIYIIAKRRCANWLQREKNDIQSLEATDTAILDKSAYVNYIAEQREKAATEQRREIVDKLSGETTRA